MTLPIPAIVELNGQTFELSVEDGGRIGDCHVDLALWCGRPVKELSAHLAQVGGRIRGLGFRGQLQLQYVARTGQLFHGQEILKVAMGQARGLSEVHVGRCPPQLGVGADGEPTPDHRGSDSAEEKAALRFLLRALAATVPGCPPPPPSEPPAGSATGSRTKAALRRAR